MGLPLLKLQLYKLFLSIIFLFLLCTHFIERVSAKDVDVSAKIAFTIPLEAATFEITKTLYSAHREITGQLFWPLLFKTKQGKVKPASAERWKIENYGKSIRFYLRKDLKWSDGTPLTAHDFYRTIKRIASQNELINKTLLRLKGWQKWANGDLDAEIGVTVVNDHELLFQFKNQSSLQINDFAETTVIAISEEDYNDTKDKPWIKATKKLSYGPYKIKTASDDKIVIEKNPYFPESDDVEIDEVEYTGGSYEDGIEQYSSDKIDVLSGPIGKQKRWIVNTYGNNVIDVGPPRVYFLWPDHRKAIFANKEILDALFISLDRSTFGNALFGSKINSLPSNIPNGMGGYPQIGHPDIVQPLDERLAKAKQIMTKYGYSKNNLLTIKLGIAPVPGYNAIAALVKGSWKSIFVNVEFFETNTFYNMTDNFRAGDYDVTIGSFIDQNGNPYQYLMLLNEYSLIAKIPADPQYLEMLDDILRHKSTDDHISALQKLDTYILDKKLVMPIVANAPMAILKPKFSHKKEATQYIMPKISFRHLKLKSHD